MEDTQMKPLYKEYYRCSSKGCDSVYHVSMLDKHEFLCKDCNNVSKVPREANEKSRPKRDYNGRRN